MTIPVALPIGQSGLEFVTVGGRRQWRDVPSRNILDVIDPVASDHTAAVRQAYLDHAHWHVPPDTTVRVAHGDIGLFTAPFVNASIVIPQGGSLAGQDAKTSIVQIIDDYYSTPASLDYDRAVFSLGGPKPQQAIRGLIFRGAGGTPMPNRQGQGTIFWERNVPTVLSDFLPSVVLFEDCLFTESSGFSIHTLFARVHTRRCSFVDMGNGWNVNGNGILLTECHFLRSEGAECGGHLPQIVRNLFEEANGIAGSLGGYFTPDRPEYHSGIFGWNVVLGSTGVGCSVAESMSDAKIVHNYFERTVNQAIDILDRTIYLSNGTLVDGNVIASCGQGILIGQDNTRVVNNRIYRRADLTSPATTTVGIAVYDTADNVLLDGNDVSGSAANFTLNGTNMRWGPGNRASGGTTVDIQVQASGTFQDARHLGSGQRALASGNFLQLETDSVITLDAGGGSRTLNLLTAAGKKNRRLVLKKIDAVGANTWTIDPAGAETIDGAATKVMGSPMASLVLYSDGTNWRIESQTGTIT